METVRDLEKTKTWSQEGCGSSSRSQERSWKDGHHLHSGGGGYDGGGGGGGARRSDDDVHTIRLAMVKIDCNMALPSKSADGTLAPELLTPRCPRSRLGCVTYSQATKSSGSLDVGVIRTDGKYGCELVTYSQAIKSSDSHTCKKRVMLRRWLFWPKKFAEKVRKSRQNVNRDKSA